MRTAKRVKKKPSSKPSPKEIKCFMFEPHAPAPAPKDWIGDEPTRVAHLDEASHWVISVAYSEGEPSPLFQVAKSDYRLAFETLLDKRGSSPIFYSDPSQTFRIFGETVDDMFASLESQYVCYDEDDPPPIRVTH